MPKKKRAKQQDSNLQISRSKLKIDHIISLSELKLKFRTESQKEYWNLIQDNEISLCFGPAGTGKSYISVAKALHLLLQLENNFEKIIIIKPVVEADEKLGALPGDIEEKLQPYIYPTIYIFEKIIGREKTKLLLENDIIEQRALAYIRGVNIDNAILIFEEAQNSTPRQMKTLLTRIGENAKFIISGDLEQNDRYKKKEEAGLYDAIQKLKNIEGIGTFEFGNKDIVRNPLIGKILEKYNKNGETIV